MQLSGQNKCLSCARSVVKSEGIIALYRSLPITMFMNAPYHISTVVINENMKKIVEPKKRKFKFMSYFFCAAFAGGISSLLTCPMDNIKTRLQTQNTLSSCEIMEAKILNSIKDEKCSNEACENQCINDKKEKFKINKVEINQKSIQQDLNCHHIDPNEDLKNVKYKNIRDTISTLYRNDGVIKGFYRGALPRMLFNAPSCAISWMSYEFMKHLLSGDYLKV